MSSVGLCRLEWDGTEESKQEVFSRLFLSVTWAVIAAMMIHQVPLSLVVV